jgi:hypothetical protein
VRGLRLRCSLNNWPKREGIPHAAYGQQLAKLSEAPSTRNPAAATPTGLLQPSPRRLITGQVQGPAQFQPAMGSGVPEEKAAVSVGWLASSNTSSTSIARRTFRKVLASSSSAANRNQACDRSRNICLDCGVFASFARYRHFNARSRHLLGSPDISASIRDVPPSPMSKSIPNSRAFVNKRDCTISNNKALCEPLSQGACQDHDQSPLPAAMDR